MKYIDLILNSRLYARLKQCGGGHHAYLLTGEDSEALRLTALLFSASQIEEQNSLSLTSHSSLIPNCLDQIMRGVYPDVRELPGTDGKYNKAVIEGFFEGLYMTPVISDKVYYVLHNAHDISERWQNALLKTLEEPSPRVSFILTAVSRNRLLPTIGSRCIAMEGDIFSAEHLYAELSKHYPAGSELQSAIMSADGKLTEAVRNLENAVSDKILDTVLDTLISLNKSSRLALYIGKLAVYGDELTQLLNQMMSAVRDAMCMLSGKPELITLRYKEQKIKELADKLKITACLNIISDIDHALLRYKQNGHTVSIIEELLMKVLEAKHK